MLKHNSLKMDSTIFNIDEFLFKNSEYVPTNYFKLITIILFFSAIIIFAIIMYYKNNINKKKNNQK